MEKTVVGIELLDIDTASLPELESGIIELASDIAAAEAVWLSMIAAFDVREGWAGHGVVSCAHWLSWRCGLSLPTAHEKVRVSRALTNLPTTTAAFEKGELSYSRARAITRVATPETEAELVELARHSTGAQLERVVRAMSGVLKADEVKERSFHRSVSWHWEEDGSLRLNARLDPIEGAAVINAIEAAQAADWNAKTKPSSDGETEVATTPEPGENDGPAEDELGESTSASSAVTTEPPATSAELLEASTEPLETSAEPLETM